MRRKLVVVAILVALALLGSCDFFSIPVTMDQCISNFMSAINSDKASVYKSLATDSAQYGLALSSGFWEAHFPSGSTYTLSGKSTAGETVSGSITGGVYSSEPISFDMIQDAKGSYVISTINFKGGAIFF